LLDCTRVQLLVQQVSLLFRRDHSQEVNPVRETL
jgi:hypothetical protein